MARAEWSKNPPTGSLWLVEDTLTQLIRVGVDIGGPVPSRTNEMLDQAQTVHDDEQLWRRVPATVNNMTREALRTRLLAALNGCRGFN